MTLQATTSPKQALPHQLPHVVGSCRLAAAASSRHTSASCTAAAAAAGGTGAGAHLGERQQQGAVTIRSCCSVQCTGCSKAGQTQTQCASTARSQPSALPNVLQEVHPTCGAPPEPLLAPAPRGTRSTRSSTLCSSSDSAAPAAPAAPAAHPAWGHTAACGSEPALSRTNKLCNGAATVQP